LHTRSTVRRQHMCFSIVTWNG